MKIVKSSQDSFVCVEQLSLCVWSNFGILARQVITMIPAIRFPFFSDLLMILSFGFYKTFVH